MNANVLQCIFFTIVMLETAGKLFIYQRKFIGDNISESGCCELFKRERLFAIVITQLLQMASNVERLDIITSIQLCLYENVYAFQSTLL